MAGIANKVLLFNETLKLVVMRGNAGGEDLGKRGLHSIARIIRLLIAAGENDPVFIAAEAIRRLENGGTETRAGT